MSQDYAAINGSDTLTASRGRINLNFDAVASDFAGTAFPTLNLTLGMVCFRTDGTVAYRLTQLSPAVWTRMFTEVDPGTKSDVGHVHDGRYHQYYVWNGTDMMIGGYANPMLRFYYPGVIHYRIYPDSSGTLIFSNADNGTVYTQIATNGNYWCTWRGQWLSTALDTKYENGSYMRMASGSFTDAGTGAASYFQCARNGGSGFYVGLLSTDNDGYVRASGSNVYIGVSGGNDFSVHGTRVRPTGNNTHYCGDSSYRWIAVYAVTAAIQTSDERLKTMRKANEAEMRVAQRLRREFLIYQWNEKLEAEGPDGARFHAGASAQRVKACFEAEGLDAARYSIWCEDDEIAVDCPEGAFVKDARKNSFYKIVQEPTGEKDADGNDIMQDVEMPVQGIERKTGGKLYALRYEELHSFILAGLSAEMEHISMIAKGEDPTRISDRQFFWGLYKWGVLGIKEAKAAIKVGDIPQTMMEIIDQVEAAGMIPPGMDRDDIETLIEGATEYRLDHPVSQMIAAALQWDEHRLKDFWSFCATL